MRNFVGTKTGEIVAKTGLVSYVVKLASGDQRRHIDHLRLRLIDSGQDKTRGPDPSHNGLDWRWNNPSRMPRVMVIRLNDSELIRDVPGISQSALSLV